MHYNGTPFVKEKAIKENNLNDYKILYTEIACDKKIADFIVQRSNNAKIDLIFYVNAKTDEDTLWVYHKQNYPNISYFTEDFLSEKTVKQCAFEQGVLKSYRITFYNEQWLELKTQIYNKDSELIEFQEFFYHGNETTPHQEKIFSVSNWTIHTENFL